MLKNAQTLEKVDLAREERIKLNDEVIETLKQIKDSPRMTKISAKNGEVIKTLLVF
jgi:hypothetical protein